MHPDEIKIRLDSIQRDIWSIEDDCFDERFDNALCEAADAIGDALSRLAELEQGAKDRAEMREAAEDDRAHAERDRGAGL